MLDLCSLKQHFNIVRVVLPQTFSRAVASVSPVIQVYLACNRKSTNGGSSSTLRIEFRDTSQCKLEIYIRYIRPSKTLSFLLYPFITSCLFLSSISLPSHLSRDQNPVFFGTRDCTTQINRGFAIRQYKDPYEPSIFGILLLGFDAHGVWKVPVVQRSQPTRPLVLPNALINPGTKSTECSETRKS